MKVSLVVMNAGKVTGQTIPVTLSQFIIGRDPQCNLRPASAVISKRHCAILVKNGKVSVRDFESTNGTFINENPVKGEVPLNHEDILKVGPLAFRVVIEKTTPVNKPTPPPAAAPKPASSGSEEDVAAMLLSLQEETGGDNPQATQEESDIPGGSTVMDMVPLPALETKADQPVATSGAAAKVKTPPPPNAPPPSPVKGKATPPPAAAATPAPAQAKTPAPAPAPAKEPEKPKEPEPVAASAAPAASTPKPPEKKPAGHATARDAAKAILDKYVKRSRS